MLCNALQHTHDIPEQGKIMKTANFDIKTNSKTLSSFATILQAGIIIPIHAETTFADLILSIPGFTQKYIEETVQTIFVNAVPIDNIHQCIIPGSVIALSAAMPGLAGAIFRREGMHGSLRSRRDVQFDQKKDNKNFVTVKIFNSIALDRAEDIFGAGILLNIKSVCDFFTRRCDILNSLQSIFINKSQCSTFDDIIRLVGDAPYASMRITITS